MNVQDSRPGGAPLFVDNRPSETATEAVLRHPQFAQAARAVAEGLVALYRDHHVMNAVLADRVRYIVGVFAIYLHLSATPDDPKSGLTVSRLRRLCVEREVCSAGRAEATLATMREFGHIAELPSEEDRRLLHLAPAPPLLDWHRERCIHFFSAAAHVMPDGAALRAAVDQPAFMRQFMAELGATHVDGFHYVEHIPHIKVFYEHNAGGPLLMSLLLSGEGDDFPPSQPLRISISALARSYRVSRVHVRRVLQSGVRAGLIARDGDGEAFEISPQLADAVRQALATYVIHYSHCARRAFVAIAQQAAAV